MAKASISVDQDQFLCPVCLDLLKDPVTIPCGHSFCKVCINNCWDQEDQKGVYSCPHCRDNFTPRPLLCRNTLLADLVKKQKKPEIQAASRAHCYAGPGDVECDSCTGRKYKAVKSCLTCLASYCELHLTQHYQSPTYRIHTIIEASANLQEKICSQHCKPLEIYCRTDQICICYLCMMETHNGHDIITTAAGCKETQRMLKKKQTKSQQRIQEKQKEVQELKQVVNTIKLSAQTAVEDSERIFTEMISSMEKKRSEVTELIRTQEKAELSQAEDILKQLEQEIADLQKKTNELEHLLHTNDHIHILKAFGQQSFPPVRSNLTISSINDQQPVLYDGVRNSLSALKTRFEEFCEEEFNKIPLHAAAESESIAEFRKLFFYLTLNPNTAHRKLSLSEKNRVVIRSVSKQTQAYHRDRFDSHFQVLSKESVCERCYWEVEWRGEVEIAVSYKRISRKGKSNKCVFGGNDQSWSLWCSSTSLSFYHNNHKTDLGVPSSFRIGVYVECSAGTLSFYSISNTTKLLHRVHTTFTQPLYAGFGFYTDFSSSSIRLCDPK